MAFCQVTVTKPLNRLIYINGKYAKAAGNSGEISFRVPTGRQTFETLNGNGQVDYRRRVRINPENRTLEIELEPVDPPEDV